MKIKHNLYKKLIILYLFIFTQRAESKCNFNASNYIDELNSSNNIKEIIIETPKSKSYTINFLKSILSDSTTKGSIDPKLRKKFKANINVNYKFGSCNLSGKIWQNGDFKDHLEFKDGKPLRSLNAKLDTNNIINSTKFKLFIPKTRNNLNEILGTILLREFDVLAPETFQVPVKVNGISSIMLFQEDARKELLERNLRREGPVFEGDESLLWDNPYGYFKLENISLSKLINKNWFLKGDNSRFITLKSYILLQNAYIEYTNLLNETGNKYYLNPNNKTDYKFKEYHFLMSTMNGLHGLRPHNRKFFFNVIENQFEPIYYDGDLNLRKKISNKEVNELIKKLKLPKDFNIKNINKLNDQKFIAKIRDEFKKRVISFDNYEKDFFDNSINALKANSKLMQDYIKINGLPNFSKKEYSINRSKFIENKNLKEVEKGLIDSIYHKKTYYNVKLADGTIKKINYLDLSKIISRKKLNKDYFLFLPKVNNFQEKIKKKQFYVNNSIIEILNPDSLEVEINKEKKILKFKQNRGDGKILIKGGTLDGWDIVFKGIESLSKKDETISQRFDKNGLTGCLTIYNTKLDKVSFNLVNGNCEDSLNLINSNGNIKEINIKNAPQDAVDIDFSNLNIDSTKVNSAGNDCIDFSGSDVIIKKTDLEKCNDKGISIGEKSKIYIDQINIINSETGISVKDYSVFDNNFSAIKNTNICIESFQKKQEFGGAKAYLKYFICNGKKNIDNNSQILRK